MPSAVSSSSVARRQPLDQAPVVRGAGVDEVAGHVQEHRAADADEPGEALRAAAAGNQPELDLRLPELSVVGRNPDVAAHRDLEPAAQAVALDRRDERSPRRVHAIPELLDPACRPAFLSFRRRLSQRGELGDVSAGDERALSRALEHDRANSVVRIEAIDLRLELVEQSVRRAR